MQCVFGLIVDYFEFLVVNLENGILRYFLSLSDLLLVFSGELGDLSLLPRFVASCHILHFLAQALFGGFPGVLVGVDVLSSTLMMW